MVQGVERDEAKFTFSEKDDVFSVTNVLKQCRRSFHLYLDLNIDWADGQISENCLNLSSPSLTPSGSSTRKNEVSPMTKSGQVAVY